MKNDIVLICSRLKRSFVWTFLTLAAKAFSSVVTHDMCSNWRDCSLCTQRTFPINMKPEQINNCVWCDALPQNGAGCISSERGHVCISESTRRSDQCKDKSRTLSLLERNCKPIVTRNYVVHIESISADIYGVVQTIPGVENFEVWIGVCKEIHDAEVLKRCGQHAPIQVIETDSILTTPDPNVTYRCWIFGQNVKEDPYMVNVSNPLEGIVLHYGYTTCPSDNQTDINVTVLVKPEKCEENDAKATVSAGNFEVLKTCSSENAHLEIEVESSILCERNIEWRLSARDTIVYCVRKDAYHLECSMTLKSASGALNSYDPRVYQNRFRVNSTFVNGTSLITRLTFTEDSLMTQKFIVDAQNVCNLSIYYTYPGALPERLLINETTNLVVTSCKNSGSNTIEVVVVVVVVACGLIVIAIVVVVYKFGIERQRKNVNIQRNESCDEEANVSKLEKRQSQDSDVEDGNYTRHSESTSSVSSETKKLLASDYNVESASRDYGSTNKDCSDRKDQDCSLISNSSNDSK